MPCGRKKRKTKINKHKRKKRMRRDRHKKKYFVTDANNVKTYLNNSNNAEEFYCSIILRYINNKEKTKESAGNAVNIRLIMQGHGYIVPVVLI